MKKTMRKLFITPLLCLICINPDIWAQNESGVIFNVGLDLYEILTTEDGSLSDEVRLWGGLVEGFRNSSYEGTGFVPDEVEYEGKKYKVAEFVIEGPYWEFEYRGENPGDLSLGKFIRRIEARGWRFDFSRYEIREGNPYFKSIDGILYTHDGKTLIHCPTKNKTEKGLIPDSVEVIGEGAFANNTTWNRNIKFPKALKIIEEYAFQESAAVPYLVELPPNVETIEDWAFRRNYHMCGVVLPEGLKNLGEEVFDGNYKLKSLTIPSSVESIGTISCNGTSYIDTIICKRPTPPAVKDKDLFIRQFDRDHGYFMDEALLYVPKGSREAYKNDECWGKFNKILEIGEGEKIGKCAAPTIQYLDGKLVCTSATEGAKCITTILAPDQGMYEDSEIPLKALYSISVIAKKNGFDDSDVVTATLYWMEKELEVGVDDVQANARPIIISNTGNTLTVQGAEDGESITAYTLDGKLLGSTVCRNGQANLPLGTTQTEIVIIKVGEKAVKVRVR